ncbi:MAG TPA: ATP-binding protein [Polyangiaceae bacterium]|nr:ATP-binding protein [Polyangiaceae bacterium]
MSDRQQPITSLHEHASSGEHIGTPDSNLERTPHEWAAREALLRQLMQERARLSRELGERVKELSLLHQASRLLRRAGPVDLTLLQDVCLMLPAAWQYPEVCEARIRYGDLDARTAGFRGSDWRQEARFRTADGRVGVIEVVYLEERPTAGEGPFLLEERRLIQSLADMLAVHADQRCVEAELRHSQQKFATVFLAAPVALCITRQADGQMLDLNYEFERLFGYSRAEAIGHTTIELGMWPNPDDRKAYVYEIPSGVLHVAEMRLRHRDGRIIPLRNSLHRLDLNGETCVLSAFIDMSAQLERQALEQQLQHAQKMEAVGRLAAGVAHDFNNLLAVITMCSDVLREDLPANSGAQTELLEIGEAAERAEHLTRQLLAFSRQQVLEPRLLSANELVSKLQNMLQRVLGADVELRTKLDPACGMIKADAGQLEQVIINLALNGRDAMPEGGQLQIATACCDAPPEAGQSSGPWLVLSVRDTGTGMDAETRARIFEPFFTTKPPGKGTGLGLSTAYGIVRQSGGVLDVTTELGRGSTFRIFLPCADGSEELPVTPTLQRRTSGGNEVVLVVEDQPAIRHVIHKILARLGYQVLEAASPHLALEVSRRHSGPIHALLTDLVLPGGSGRKLGAELLLQRPRLRVLYMSGFTDDAAVSGGALEPGSAFIQKPFSAAMLAARLREVLDRAPRSSTVDHRAG